jgi:hypothetical protein
MLMNGVKRDPSSLRSFGITMLVGSSLYLLTLAFSLFGADDSRKTSERQRMEEVSRE